MSHKLENTGVSDCLCTAKDTAEEVVEGLNSVGRQVVVVLNCMNSVAALAPPLAPAILVGGYMIFMAN